MANLFSEDLIELVERSECWEGVCSKASVIKVNDRILLFFLLLILILLTFLPLLRRLFLWLLLLLRTGPARVLFLLLLFSNLSKSCFLLHFRDPLLRDHCKLLNFFWRTVQIPASVFHFIVDLFHFSLELNPAMWRAAPDRVLKVEKIWEWFSEVKVKINLERVIWNM